jgi:transcriptional regulator with XRE-family HTH domain
MTRLDLLKRVQKRKKEIGLTIDNISKLSSLGNRTITRFLAGKDVKMSTVESITHLLGLDFAGNEIVGIKTLRHNRAKEKALYIVSLVQDTSSLEQQGLESEDLDLMLLETQNEFLTGKYQKNLWAN